MFSPGMVAERIKGLAKDQGVSVGAMLSECSISKNALSSMQSGGFMPRADNIGKIADYLGCSVDFLLGRTDVVAVGAMPDEAVVLSDDELVLLERYRSLTGGGKEIVRSRALEQLQIENLSRGNGESATSAG